MGKKYFVVLFSVVLMAFLPARLHAQATEADVIRNAAAAFDRQDYAAAMPLYSQLLSNHPKDPNYSYRFGVCMLFASADKGKALPFLEDASKDPKCEVDVWFYLGRAYHLNYRFDEAIVAFNKYKTLAGQKKAEKLQVDNQIAMCKTGKKLLKAVTDITVLEKKELPVADFFRSYNLEGYSGQLLVKPDEFKTSLDRKKNETSIIFLSGEKNTLYFSSYGDDESTGKDIYRVVRLPSGGWSKPFNVGYPINTEFDEDYPFLHPNGKVLYFASKGHNSMGGYDIFRSELNEETGSWLKPTNMDFAINSPDDDILFVTDFEEKTAWFASARNSPQGFMTVYHVVIERRPVNTCIIAGTFKPSGIDPTPNAKITVRNEETNQPVGVYTTNSSTGAYLINLPNTGGKYTFTVEKGGVYTQTKTVTVPPQYQLKPIRQEIFYTESNGEQNLNVVTYFNDDTASFAPDFLRDKANLDVSPDGGTYQVVDMGNPGTSGTPGSNTANKSGNTADPVEENDSADTGEETDPAANVVSSSHGTVTTAELIKAAYQDAAETKQEAAVTHQQADRAFTYAADVNQRAKDKQAEADAAKTAADALPAGSEKTKALTDAAALQAEANSLQSQTVAAFNVANGLNDDAKHKDQEAKVADQYAHALEDGSKKSGPAAMDAANSLEQQLNDMSDVRSQAQETAKNAQQEADKKRGSLQLAKSQLDDAQEERKANVALLAQLRSDSAKEKDRQLREGYASQIEGVLENIADNDADIKKKQAQVSRLTNELNALENEAAGAKLALDASKNPAVVPVALTAEEKKALQDNVAAYQNRVEDNTALYAPATQTQTVRASDPQKQDGNPVTANTNPQNTATQPPDNNGTANGNNTNNAQPNNPQPVAQQANAAGEKSDRAYDSRIAGTSTITDAAAREDAKERIYTNWADSLGNEAAKLEKIAVKERNAKKKAEINQQAADLRAAAQEKRDNAEAAHTAAENARSNSTVAQNPASQNNAAQTSGTNTTTEIADAADVITDVQGNVSEAIQEAENEPDPVKREALIGDAHRTAEKQLDEKIAASRNDLKKENDPARKQEIQNNIDRYVAEKNAQHKLAVASDQRATQNQNGAAVVEQPADPFAEYVTGVANADTISDPVSREAKKAETYTSWAAQLDAKIADDKKALSATKTKTEKDSLKQLIAAEEVQSKELKQNAQQAKVAQQVAAAQQNSPGAKSDRAYDNRIAGTNAITGVAEREDAKEAIYTSWADSLDNEATKLEKIAVKERNAKKKTEINQQAAELRTAAQEKRDLADESYTAAENARTAQPQTVATNSNPQSNNPQTPVSNNVVPNTNVNTNVQNVNTQPVAEPNAVTANPVVEDNVTYTDPEAKAALTERNRLNAEAQVYRQQQDSLIAAAGQASGERKKELLADATDAQRKAWEKEAQASAKQGEAGREQFDTNAQLISSYKTNAGGNPSDKIAQADLVNDEAAVLMRKANDKRNEAKLAGSPYARKTALDEAEEFELQAIQKQQEAIRLYQQAGVQPAVAMNPNTKNPTSQDPNARVGNPETQNPATQNTNTQNTATQPANTQPQNPVSQNTNTQTPEPRTPNTNTQSANTQSPEPRTQSPVTPNTNTQPANTQSQNPVSQNTNTQPANTQNQNPVAQNTAPRNQNPDPANTSRVATQLKPGETFRITSQPNTQPIPVDPPVPSGIVYKVQIGAFRNPIPVDLFQGIQPLNAELVGNGITRYTAGQFIDFANADAAKREIRAMGYPDAFVVAYKDGKRISVADARREQEGGNAPVVQQPNVATPNNVVVQQPNMQQPANTQTPNNTNVAPNTNGAPQPTYGNEAPAVDVKTTKELFYTVQVGVYSRPVSAAKLYNLPGLFSERTPNGYIRYAAGKYNNVAAANAAKDNVVNIGVKDAFVTAYFEGQRITPERAAELERQGVVPAGSGAANAQGQRQAQPETQSPQAPVWEPNQSNQSQQRSNLSGQSQPQQQGQQPNNQREAQPANPVVTQPSNPPQDMTPIPVIANTKPNIPDTGLVFSVQLGAYREFVPIAMANRFLLFASKGVSIYRDSNSGLTVYQVGAYGNYKEAASLKEDAIAKGINDAFIVAWKDGVKIPMEEALKIRPQ